MTNYNNGYNPGGQNQPPQYSPPSYTPQAGIEPPEGYVQKNRIVAGCLAIFVGVYGLHNFYLGNTSKGLMQLLVATLGAALTCGISTIVIYIWGILDGVKLLDGRINIDANGVFLKH